MITKRPGEPAFCVSVVLLTVVLSHACPTALANGERERISCFLIGETHPSLNPLTGYFAEDPLFKYSLERIPSGLTDPQRQRLDRLYYPRTRKALLESYDILFFSDARIQHFTPTQFHDLDYAFREAGMPSFWSFGPSYGMAIENKILSEALPISAYSGYIHRPWRVVFRRERDPVFLPFISLGMESVPGEAYGAMKTREGSTIWADMEPLDLPWMVSWRPGENGGVTWVNADELNLYWWGLEASVRGCNPYAIDMMTNLVLYSVGRPLVSDILARRDARQRISAFMAQKSSVLSLLEWADLFGANTLPLSTSLTQLDSVVATATDEYLGQEYAASISQMDEVAQGLAQLSARAVHLKDEALVWVYISEWSAVTSTGVITGLVLWTLMVRKRMYKAVGVTKPTSLE